MGLKSGLLRVAVVVLTLEVVGSVDLFPGKFRSFSALSFKL